MRKLVGAMTVFALGICLHCLHAEDAATAGQKTKTSPEDRKKEKRAAERAGDEMNRAEKYLEEYGSINISAPILTKLNSSAFNFDLNRGATNYFLDAKNQVQTAASSFQQTIQSLSLSAQAQWDPTVTAAYTAQLQNYFSDLNRFQKKQNLTDLATEQQYQAQLSTATNADQRAQALANYAQNYTASSNAPAYPTDDQSNTNLPPIASSVAQRPGVTNVLSSQQFLGPQGLLSGLSNPPNPTLSDRAAILQAVGDYATESIFRHFIGNTNLGSESAEDNLFFGLSTVSVNPGWRTKKGWAAEALLTAEVYYTTGRMDVVKRVFSRVTGTNFDANIAPKLYNQYGGNALSSPDQAIHLSTYNQLRANEETMKNLESQSDALKSQSDTLKSHHIGAQAMDFNSIQQELKLDKQMADLNKQMADLDEARSKLHSQLPTNYVPPAFWVITNQNLADIPTIPVPATIISPLIDAESQDLSDSTRSQTEFALALSFALRYAGLNAQANAFEQFVKSKQFDIRSVAQSVAVNAFSGADGKFGFQVGPRLRALGNPTDENSGPSHVLDRQSFPVLLILALDGVDLEPKLWQYGDTNHLIVLEPQIRFTETRRWTPLKHCSCLFGLDDWNEKSLTEPERLNAVYELKEAREDLADAKLSSDVTGAFITRIENLEEQLAGGNGKVFLAADDIIPQLQATNKPPVLNITGTVPAQFVINTNQDPSLQQIAFFGAGLEQISTNLTPATVSIFPTDMTNYVSLATNQAQRVGQALSLTLSVTNRNFTGAAADKIALLKFTTTNSQAVFSTPLVFTVKQPAPSPDDKSKKITFSNTGASATGGFTYTVTVATNVDSKDVMDLAGQLIKSDLEKNKPAGSSTNTLLNVTVRPDAIGTNGTFQLKF